MQEKLNDPEKTPLEKGVFWLAKFIGIIDKMEKQLEAYKANPNCNEKIIAERTELINDLKNIQATYSTLYINLEKLENEKI